MRTKVIRDLPMWTPERAHVACDHCAFAVLLDTPHTAYCPLPYCDDAVRRIGSYHRQTTNTQEVDNGTAD